jgi:hypothetical protein
VMPSCHCHALLWSGDSINKFLSSQNLTSQSPTTFPTAFLEGWELDILASDLPFLSHFGTFLFVTDSRDVISKSAKLVIIQFVSNI